jgi:cytosine/adenosine deaminase-related metal-dependent hydrolase
VGVLTGYDQGRTFVLEHVIAFPHASPTDLRAMALAGLHEAQARGFQSVVFHVPHAHPLAARLVRLGRRLGFTQYEEDGERGWWVKWL